MPPAGPKTFLPQFDGHVPSLGYFAAEWIEAHCCHGPGDVAGEPAQVTDEVLDFLIAAYLLDPVTGARQVDEAVLSRSKGWAKSEVAGWIGTFEAFGECRFDGWDAHGQPVGRRIRSPLLKCLATEESQAGNTFENIAFIASEWGPDVHPELFAGVGGVRQYQSATSLYLPSGGEVRAATAGAASKDGGKETWACADETHLYVLRELRSMYATVRRNLGKRKLAEPWLMQTTTMFRAGEQSIAEQTLTAWRKGTLPTSTLVDHRQAKGRIDIEDHDHTLSQLAQVYGDAADWMDLERIYRLMLDPTVCPDVGTAARYFLNREHSHADVFVPADVVERQAVAEVVNPGEHICLGFDGSLSDDSTVLIGSRMSDGFVFPLGIWGKPDGPQGYGWEVPRDDVAAVVSEVFDRYDVVRMYCDPHEWRSDIGVWSAAHPERVFEWPTSRYVAMDAALDRLRVDLVNGVLWHSGDTTMAVHFVNAVDARRGRLRLVKKPSHERKIDSVIGAALAYEARADALADGWKPMTTRRLPRRLR